MGCNGWYNRTPETRINYAFPRAEVPQERYVHERTGSNIKPMLSDSVGNKIWWVIRLGPTNTGQYYYRHNDLPVQPPETDAEWRCCGVKTAVAPGPKVRCFEYASE